MTKIGDKVGYDCCTGDVIRCADNTGELHNCRVEDTYPNQVRISVENGDSYLILYRELIARSATFVSLREKVSL